MRIMLHPNTTLPQVLHKASWTLLFTLLSLPLEGINIFTALDTPFFSLS